MSTRTSVMGLGLCTVLAAACVETEAMPLSAQTLEALRSYGVDDVVYENDVMVAPRLARWTPDTLRLDVPTVLARGSPVRQLRQVGHASPASFKVIS